MFNLLTLRFRFFQVARDCEDFYRLRVLDHATPTHIAHNVAVGASAANAAQGTGHIAHSLWLGASRWGPTAGSNPIWVPVHLKRKELNAEQHISIKRECSFINED